MTLSQGLRMAIAKLQKLIDEDYRRGVFWKDYWEEYTSVKDGRHVVDLKKIARDPDIAKRVMWFGPITARELKTLSEEGKL